jgi:hypothetical protein
VRLLISLWLVLVLTTGVAALVAIMTGAIKRAYATLDSNALVSIKNSFISIEDLAFKHQPLLFMRRGTMSPPALGIWWEAVDAGDSIALIYHPVWQDEVHPIPWMDKLYRLYRAVYYGFPIRDIEYIQVNIQRSDGLIIRIRYEDTSAESYYAPTSDHRPVIINRNGSDYIEQTNRSKKISVNGAQIEFGIATWSHQLTLLGEDKQSYTVPVNMQLSYLHEEDYKRYRLARRSQGDFITRDSSLGRLAKIILIVTIMLLPYTIVRIREKLKR